VSLSRVAAIAHHGLCITNCFAAAVSAAYKTQTLTLFSVVSHPFFGDEGEFLDSYSFGT